jgi:hypothetical protein
MNKLIIILILLTSCNDKTPQEIKESQTEYSKFNTQIYVVVVDSCEYIVASKTYSDGGVSIIHKHNCKFCSKR